MFYSSEKVPLLLKAKEVAFLGSFFGLALLMTVAWSYLLGSIFLKFVIWCFS
jgi:hypothetical protein